MRTANPKANVGGYSFYYSVIKGFDAYGAGKADTISGMTAVDDHTLQVEVTAADRRPRATGLRCRRRLRSRRRRPATRRWASPTATTRTTGASWSPQVRTSSRARTHSTSPCQRRTRRKSRATSRVARSSWCATPSWDPSTDDLRPAYPDQISVGDRRQQRRPLQQDQGERPGLRRGRRGAARTSSRSTRPIPTSRTRSTPPVGRRSATSRSTSWCRRSTTSTFGKAFNWALDKQGMRQLRGGERRVRSPVTSWWTASQNNLLKDYDPYATPNSAGDLDKAKAEMAQSKYDTNHDGAATRTCARTSWP